MLTTPDLRRQFESSFHKIIRSLTPELQKKWDGEIVWKDDRSYPAIQAEMIALLPAASKAVYVSLLNKLSRGRI